MRARLLVLVALVAGCIEQHPAWTQAGTEGGTSAGSEGAGTSGAGTAGSGTAGTAATTPTGTSGSATGGTTTGSDGGTTGSASGTSGSSTTGASDSGSSGSSTGGVSHRVFVTSTVWAGDFGSLTAGDALCQAAADAEQLGGSWKAILSDGSTDARDRLTIAGPVENMAAELVAADGAELWGGALQAAIGYDEQGMPSATNAWTGTDDTGVALGFHCADWSPADANDRGWGGDPTATDVYWTYGSWQFCLSTMRALYCISQ